MTFIMMPPSGDIEPPSASELLRGPQVILPDSGEYKVEFIPPPMLTYREALRIERALRYIDVRDNAKVIRAICEEFQCAPVWAVRALEEMNRIHKEMGEVVEPNQMPYVVVFECDNNERRYLRVDGYTPSQTTLFSQATLWPNLDAAREYVDDRVMGSVMVPKADIVYYEVDLKPIRCQHRYDNDVCVYCGIDRRFVETGVKPE